MNNPFLCSREMVVGEHFIGRTEIINDISNYVFNTNPPANIAFIGVNCIGKRSLVGTTLLDQNQKDILVIDKSIIPIEVSLSISNQSSTFLQSLIIECKEALEELQLLSNPIKKSFHTAQEALQPSDPWNPWNAIKNFFVTVKQSGYCTLFIIHRFDKARSFETDAKAFKYLRELAYQPSLYGVRLVLTSRLNIKKIEETVDSVSELHGIFTNGTRYLGMFSNTDLAAYFTRFSDIGISISDEAKKHVLFYCGGHPYLLNILGWYIVDNHQNQGNDVQKNDVDEAAENISGDISVYYQNLIKLLKELGTLDKLLQILFSGTAPDQNDELKSYGLIKPTEEGTYVAYSEHFQEYLRDNLTNLQEHLKEMDIGDIGETTETVSDNVIAKAKDMWEKTERALREIITTTMSDKYGKEWIKILQTRWPSMLKQAQRRQALGENDPGVHAPQNPIHFTETADLFEIILDDELWNDCFCNIFKGYQNYWKPHQVFLAHRRNSIYHSNGLFLQPDQFKRFQGCCEEILRVLSEGASVSQELKQHTETRLVKTEGDNLASDDQKELDQAQGTASNIEESVPLELNQRAEVKPVKAQEDNPNAADYKELNSAENKPEMFKGRLNWVSELQRDLRIKPDEHHSMSITQKTKHVREIHPEGIIVPQRIRNQLDSDSLQQGREVRFQTTEKSTKYGKWRIEATKVVLEIDSPS